MSNAVTVTKEGINTLMGIEPTTHTEEQNRPGDVSFISRYSRSETDAMLSRMRVPLRNRSQMATTGGAISCLQPTHKEIVKHINTVKQMEQLAPEIEQSRTLMSSAILNPNTLQDGAFSFSFKNVPAVDADTNLAEKLSKVYEDFYNDTLELGIKSFDWIGDTQYKTGSKPILILPQNVITNLKNRSLEDAAKSRKEFMIGMESFDELYKMRDTKDDYFWSEKELTSRQILEDINPKGLLEDSIPSFESFGAVLPVKYRPNGYRATTEDGQLGNDYVAELEGMSLKLTKHLTEGDMIRFTENPDMLRISGRAPSNYWKGKMDKLKNRLNYVPEEYIDLGEQIHGKTTGHPLLIELPTESVIPIHIPGAPSEHIGYFILLDQNGQPITINTSSGPNDPFRTNGVSSPAFDAIFGGNCSNDILKKNISCSGNAVFQNLLDKYIKKRLRGIWGGDVSVSHFNAIASTMFYRLLDQKKTTIVFAPPTLLHYFAFEYRENGTGKARTDDIEFLLHLRTVFTVAKVMAAANDAVEHRKIEFNVDDKNANIEAIMEMIGKIFIDKNKLTGSLDPGEIIKNLHNNSLTIVPKGIPGLTDLDVTVETKGGQSIRPDDSLEETLTGFIHSKLDIPPGMLNQLSEPEFVRTHVTQHLYFAKKVNRYQRIWCTQMQDMIRAHSSFDPIIQKALRETLVNYSKKKTSRDLATNKAKKIVRTNRQKYDAVADKKERSRATELLLQAIMNNVEVTLPAPNVVADKAQFEELSMFVSKLNEVADIFFNNELLTNDDETGQLGLPIARAHWKKIQTIKFIERIGSFNFVDIPDMHELDGDEIVDYIQTHQQLGARVRAHKTVVGNTQIDQSGGFGDDSGGFGGDEDDGGFGDEGGFDDGMGGMDDSGGGDDIPMPSDDEDTESTPDSGAAEMYLRRFNKK